MPSSRRSPRPSSEPKSSKEPPEILHHLGRAVLSYTLKKLSEQKAQQSQQSQSRTQSSRRKSSRSKTREPSSASKRGSSRDLPRSDSGDMHALISQLAVGAFAFGIRTLIRRRREAKKKAAAATAAAGQAGARSVAREPGPAGGNTAAVDPELSAALDSVTRELQGASDSIRRLAYSAPLPSHRDCVVRDALVADADRLTGSLANMEASINNMKNLHPGLDQERRRREREKERARERDRLRERDGPRERPRERRVEEGRGRIKGQGKPQEGVATSRGIPRTEDERAKTRGSERPAQAEGVPRRRAIPRTEEDRVRSSGSRAEGRETSTPQGAWPEP